MSRRPTPRFHAIPFALAVLALTSAAAACLWDSDTLRHEAKGVPGVIDIIAGRFDRDPPLYYEMRLARVGVLVEGDPGNLGAYDDAAVACDRLGRHDEAIGWMARKRAQLDRLAAAGDKPAELAEHEYRYHANLGTFLAHRWVARGADRTGTDDLRTGRDHIARAIELNPDAHFGRERYQLLFMEWMLDPPESASEYIVPHIFSDIKSDGYLRTGALAEAGYDDAVEGLSGLIALGAAWRSVDAFIALAVALGDDGHGSLAELARLRALELVEDGGASMHPQAPTDPESLKQAILGAVAHARGDGMPRDEDKINSFFQRARASADARNAARAEYMLARMQLGEHPDTHDAFWASYTEPAAPSPPGGLFNYEQRQALAIIIVLGGFIAMIALAIALPVLRWRRVRRQRVQIAAPV